MKPVWFLAALSGLAAAGLQATPKPTEYVLFLSGNAQGYLAPCGCSSPMVGGARRRAKAIEQLGIKGRTFLFENGGLVKSAGRQDEIKLETFAQLHAAAHGAGMNLTPGEASLGPGAVLSMVRLSGNKLVSSSLDPKNSFGVQKAVNAGPFKVGGVTTRTASLSGVLETPSVDVEEAVKDLISAPSSRGKAVVLLLDGDRADAAKLARQFPTLNLIQYQSLGRPSAKAERIGNVLIASPGDGGRFLVRMVWRKDRFVSYSPIELDPSFSDDKSANAIYQTYLARIGDEQLLEALPRSETQKFSGNKACGSCHTKAMEVWQKSKHGSALHTLEREGHARDPDCVECHVVGLASIYGYRSRSETPDLADVGCESCHGAGAKHSANPQSEKMGPAGSKSCLPCHRVENSPKFDFASYWSRIRHK